jgi:predicted dehydrogenase
VQVHVQERRIRIGVVGTGHGAAIHVPALRQLPNVEVVALCGSDLDRASIVADRLGIDQVYDDVRAMLRQGRLDGVTIAAPVEQRHGAAIAAAEEGVHVLCDAPMARNAAEARDMHRLVRDAGVQHAISFTGRYTPARLRLKQLIDGGFLGDLQSVSITAFREPRLISAYRMSVGDVDADEVQLSLAQSLGSEYVDVLRWWFGDVHGVTGARLDGQLGSTNGEPDESNFGLILQFASGAIGSVHASGTCPIELGDEVVAIGTRGMLGLRGENHLFGTRRDEPMVKELPIPEDLASLVPKTPDPRVGPFSLLAHQWIHAIVSGECTAPTFEDGMKVQEVVDGGLRSQNLGRWVDTSGKRWPL